MTCFTEVNHQNRSFGIEFAVANIKHNILGAPFFKRIIQNIDFSTKYIDLQRTSSKHNFRHLTKRIIHIFHTFILLNVKNQFS